MGGIHRPGRSLALTALLLLLAPATARADAPSKDAAIAQSLFDDGRRLMSDKRYDEACPKFEESQRLDPSTGTLLNLATCRERQGRIATAWEEFKEAAVLAKRAGQADRASFAAARASALESRRSLLTVEVPAGADVAGLVLELDGVALGRPVWGTPVPVDGGSHRIVAKAEGRLPWESNVDVPPERGVRSVVVPVLAPAPPTAQEPTPSPPEPQTTPSPIQNPPESRGMSATRIAGITSAGIGAAALVVGGVFGVLTGSEFNQQKTDCQSSTNCLHHDLAVQDHRTLTTDATISTIAFIAGGVLVAGGAVLFFVGPTASTHEAGLQIGGAF